MYCYICQRDAISAKGCAKFLRSFGSNLSNSKSTFFRKVVKLARVNPNAKPEPVATHPNIQEILRERREMLNRVRADLDKVGKLQQDFWVEEQKRQSERNADK